MTDAPNRRHSTLGRIKLPRGPPLNPIESRSGISSGSAPASLAVGPQEPVSNVVPLGWGQPATADQAGEGCRCGVQVQISASPAGSVGLPGGASIASQASALDFGSAGAAVCGWAVQLAVAEKPDRAIRRDVGDGRAAGRWQPRPAMIHKSLKVRLPHRTEQSWPTQAG